MNILAVGAHYDDIELGCGGSIKKYLDGGSNVYMVVVTNSDYTHYDGTVLRTKQQAKEEGEAAAAILGVNDIRCLGWETKKVEYGFELIETLDSTIKELKIDTLFTHWQHDVHQDHSAVGKATLNAGRHCPRLLMYRSNWYKSLEVFDENFYIDISEHIEIKKQSLYAHKVEVERRGTEWIDFVLSMNCNSGMKIETNYAEAFQVVKWLEI